MGRCSKVKRYVIRHSNTAKAQHAKRTIRLWNKALDEFNEYGLGNNKVKTTTAEENKLILLTVKLVLRMQLEQVANGDRSIFTITWTAIETLVAESLQVRLSHIMALRKALYNDGEVLIFGEENGCNSIRGKGSPTAVPQSELTYGQL